MTNRLSRLLLLISILLVVSPNHGFPQNFLETKDHGTIDWSNGIVEATGVGRPPTDAENSAQARAVAQREAVRKARTRLQELIHQIQIDSSTTVQDIMNGRETDKGRLHGQLLHAPVVDVAYRKDDVVEATVSIHLAGPVADLVLPKTIRNVIGIKQPKEKEKTADHPFTGLVLDCRGLQVKPAMTMRIYDEDGSEVYGTAFVTRDEALARRMAAYVRSMGEAREHPRVGSRPLVVKGLRATGKVATDLVVSNAEAGRIRGLPSNLKFLKKCRVMIVLD